MFQLRSKRPASSNIKNRFDRASSTPVPEAEASATADTKETANLQACERKAYYAANYAEGKLGRKLTANEVWDYWREYGVDPNDRGTQNTAELANYEVPDNFDTFKTQLSRGRSAFKDKRNEDRKGRKGRSTPKADEL